MRYTDLSGREAHGEVWSPGPVINSVWVLRPDGSAAVVRAIKGKYDEIDYTPPPLPTKRQPSDADLVAAHQVLRSARYYSGDYQHLTGSKSAQVIPEKPTDLEILRAAMTQRDYFAIREARRHSIAARGGRSAVADKKLRELWESND